MRDILDIIALLDPEQETAFVRYLEGLNRRSDTKNIALFKLLRKGQTRDLDLKLYGKANANALYVLANRLQHRLIDFVAAQSFSKETSADMNCLKLLLASRIFFEQKKFKLGFKTLKRALVAAEEIEAYSILNEIYQTYIQYAHLQDQLALKELLHRADHNRAQYLQELQVTTFYAQFRAQGMQDLGADLNQQFETAMDASQLRLDKNLSYKSLYQLLSLAVETAEQQQAFYQILGLTKNILELIKLKTGLQGRYALYRMRSLHLAALSLFRNKQLEACQEALDLLANDLKTYTSYRSLLSNKFNLLQSLTHFYSNRPFEAIALLEKQNNEDLHARLTLCMFHFHQGEFDQVAKLLRNLNHSDAWYEKKMGWSWVVQKNIIEILLLVERDKLDLVLLRLRAFKRRYKGLLQEKGQERVVAFLNIVDIYYQDPNSIKDQSFIKKVESELTRKNPLEEDIFVMSFYAWLKSKMTADSLYETTLALVRTHGN
ncbi:hypothetical protein [Gilvibacter sp.]|uniref:hypothetical protein n=1 Tax=Gilvibacter sp. TaxID=2729997 RepID=UPI003B529E69